MWGPANLVGINYDAARDKQCRRHLTDEILVAYRQVGFHHNPEAQRVILESKGELRAALRASLRRFNPRGGIRR